MSHLFLNPCKKRIIMFVRIIIAGIIVAYLLTWISLLLYWWCHFYNMTPLHPEPLGFGSLLPIPPVLYKQGESDELAPQIVELYRTIEAENPGYRVVYFSNTTRRAFIVERLEHKFPGLVDAYDRLVPGAYKADLFRICVLYANGGLYGDYSQQYMVPLDTLVDRQRDELVLSLDAPMPFYPQIYRKGVACFLASRPEHPYWQHCIKQIMNNVHTEYYGSCPLDPTGPGLLQTVLDAHPETRYRMDIALLFHGNLGNKMYFPIYFQRLGTHERVIRHKLAGHYSLMLAGEHYSDVWWRGGVYGEEDPGCAKKNPLK